jgi:Protein of unknown function (DUF3631)/CHC2 zinc finger
MARSNGPRLDASRVRSYFESKLPGIRWRADHGTGRCPFHNDHRPSLSIDRKRGLFFCHGCGAKGNVRQFELRISEMKHEDQKPKPKEFKRKIVAHYTYRDEEGDPLFQQNRFKPKSFAFKSLSESGEWVWGLKGARMVPYNLPEMIGADEVFIVEGEKDADNLMKMGLTATCNPGGAGKWRDQYSTFLKGKKVYVLQDDDDAGHKHAQSVARSIAHYAKEVRLVAPFPDSKDASDWIAKGGTRKKLMMLVDATSIYDPTAESLISAEHASEHLTPPKAPLLGGPKLVRKLEMFLQKRVILPTGLAFVIALWMIGTYLSEVFDCYPYLCITSPTKRCGKTLLAELIGLVSARSKTTVNISEAALFRMIETFRPTIVMDEAETLSNRKSERAQFLLSLLNAGHRKHANVIRCVGPDHTPTEFPVYCPKVLLAIGNLPDTFRDRSIIVAMRRRRKDEMVARYRYREVSQKGRRRAALAQVWAAAHRKEVEAEYLNQTIEFLEDREADNWAPLFSIAAVAVPYRLEELKRAAIRLGSAKNALDVDDSDSVRLLSDLRQVFSSRDSKAVSTDRLISKLKSLDESPWEDLTPIKLARTLKPFNVSSRQLWINERNIRGYQLDDLKPVFDSYLST